LYKKLLNKKYISEFLWVALGNTINILGLLLIIKLFTKRLSPTEYGIYYLSLSVSIFVNQIFFGPLSNSVSRYFIISVTENESKDLLFNTFIIIKKIVLILTILFIISILILINSGEFKYILLLISTYFFSIFTGISSIISSLQNINRQRKIAAFFQVLDAIIKILVIYLFINLFSKSANVVSIATTISAFILLISQLLFIYRNENDLILDFNVNYLKKWDVKLINFSLPFSFWGIFTWAQISSDRWFLGKFSDTNSIAKYAVLFQIGYYPLTILMGYIVQTVTPILFHRAGNGQDISKIKSTTVLNFKIAILSFIITIIGSLFTFIFHDYISIIFTSSQYYEVSKYLPFMILSGGLFATSQILSLDFLSQMKINELMIIKITTALLGIFISFILIKNLGFIGAIYSNICFSVIYLLIIFFIIVFRFNTNHAKNSL